VIACFPNDTSAPETEQLTMPEKLGSGENWSDFDYPAEKSKMLVAYFSAQGHTNCGRTYCGAYRCRCTALKLPDCMPSIQ
jgi:hypothetical protein